MNLQQRIDAVNTIFGERSFFKHFDETETITGVSFNTAPDHGEVVYHYVSNGIASGGSQRIGFDDPIKKITYYAIRTAMKANHR